MSSNSQINFNIDFANYDADAIKETFGISSLDFVGEVCGNPLRGRIVGYLDDCGQARQDGMVIQLDNGRFAALTNAYTLWSDNNPLETPEGMTWGEWMEAGN